MNVLLIEDTRFFQLAVERVLVERCGAAITNAESYAKTVKVIDEAKKPFDLALVDIILPDSEKGEALDYVLQKNIPAIVFTGLFSEKTREKLLEKNIIDYVVKDSPNSLEYLSMLVERLWKNKNVGVLVVDDSPTFQARFKHLLSMYFFKVYKAQSAKQALHILDQHPDIRLMISDYYMPDMNGIDLIKTVRLRFDSRQLAIIGISSQASATLSARFIKYGANDFLSKVFQPEEFFCRIMQNMRMIEMMDNLQSIATTDYLTGLRNRAYFYDVGAKLFASAQRGQIKLTIAMLDLDFFKKINDSYGHDVGDCVLKAVGAHLNTYVRTTDIAARLGGEEFVLALVNFHEDNLEKFFEELRSNISAIKIHNAAGKQIPISCSIGVCDYKANSLDEALKEADNMLYRAKANGRNRVEIKLVATA